MNKDDLIVMNDKTGEILSIEILENIKEKERRDYYKKLFWKYNNSKYELTLEEISILRKIISPNSKDVVKVSYNNGFYMVPNNVEQDLSQLSWETNGFLHLLPFHVNKSGVIIYKTNNKPVTSFEKLRNLMGVPDKAFRRMKKDIDKYNIIRKHKLNGNIYMALNPKYSRKSYAITDYSFMAFHDFFKPFISDIDYLYLVKKFEINP